MSTQSPGGWWEGYFDERFVELYRPFLTPESTRGEVEAIVGLLDLPANARVLDLACGWGRHAIELARAGFLVTGLDLSAVLLGRAARLADEAGVQVQWVRRDMRDLAYEQQFDVVISLFSSLGYFLSDVEDLRVLQGVQRALRPGGVLLFETMHRDHVAREFSDRDWWESITGDPVWVEREFDAVQGVSREWLRWREGGEEHTKYHEIRIRTATEWARLMEAAELDPLAWYGDWDLSPFEHRSERLILLASRAP